MVLKVTTPTGALTSVLVFLMAFIFLTNMFMDAMGVPKTFTTEIESIEDRMGDIISDEGKSGEQIGIFDKFVDNIGIGYIIAIIVISFSIFTTFISGIGITFTFLVDSGLTTIAIILLFPMVGVIAYIFARPVIEFIKAIGEWIPFT